MGMRFILFNACLGTLLSLYLLFPTNITIAGEETPVPDDVIAVVNGENITREDLGNFLIERLGEQTLDVIIRRTLVFQEAKKQGVSVQPEELEESVKKVVDLEINRYIEGGGMSGEDELEAELQKMGGSVKQLRERMSARIRNEMEVQLLGEKIVGRTITITDEDLQNAYKEMYGEKIEACQIVVKSRKDGEEILKKIKAGADFETLARKESIDRSSAANGGMMNPFSPESMIGRAVTTVPIGGVSDLIKSEYGYHIVKVLNKKEASNVKFETVKKELEELVKAQQIRQKASSWLISLEESADIKKNLH